MSDFSETLAAWIKSRISTLDELARVSGYDKRELTRISNGNSVASDFAIECITQSMDVIERAHVAKHKEAAAVEDIHHVARSIEAARVDERDAVNNPKHYTSHPSGIECIQITEHMGFNLGNAVKYIWRCDLKHDAPIQDLEKAIWYIEREIKRRRGAA